VTLRVDLRTTLSVLGRVLQYLAVPVAFPLAVAVYYGESVLPFVVTILVAVVGGTALARLDPDPQLARFLFLGHNKQSEWLETGRQ
jgi:trk system potassium uptake protein TrkH